MIAQKSLAQESVLVRLSKGMALAQAADLDCGVIAGSGALLTAAKEQAGEDVLVIRAGLIALQACDRLDSGGTVYEAGLDHACADHRASTEHIRAGGLNLDDVFSVRMACARSTKAKR